MPFDYHWKGMNIWDGTGNSKRLHLSNLVKDGINVQWTWHSKHITYYSPRSGFLYYNWTTPIVMGHPIQQL